MNASEKELDAILKAADRLREAESDLGRKLLPYTINGGDLVDLSWKIGIKHPLLRELTAVALGVRERHKRQVEKMNELKKAVAV